MVGVRLWLGYVGMLVGNFDILYYLQLLKLNVRRKGRKILNSYLTLEIEKNPPTCIFVKAYAC